MRSPVDRHVRQPVHGQRSRREYRLAAYRVRCLHYFMDAARGLAQDRPQRVEGIRRCRGNGAAQRFRAFDGQNDFLSLATSKRWREVVRKNDLKRKSVTVRASGRTFANLPA